MEFVFAYIDPGSGSIIIQAVIAMLVAVPVLLRSRLRQLANSVHRKNAEPPADG